MAELEARWPLVAALLVAASVCALAWPLLTYSLTLAVFGLPHVLSELRYVERRYRGRAGPRMWLPVIALLGVIAGLRVLERLGVVGDGRAGVELLCGVGLALAVWPAMRVGVSRAVAIVTACTLAIAVVLDPILALLAFAVLHNVTPVGLLLADHAPRERPRILAFLGLAFVAMPMLLFSGALSPKLWSGLVGVASPETDLLGAGPLDLAMRAYLPSWWPHAYATFAMCVYLQCAHYVCVLLILPTRLPAAPPRWSWILALAMVLGAMYAVDFRAARAWYGTAAAVHAWVEVPVLLLALGGAFSGTAHATHPTTASPH